MTNISKYTLINLPTEFSFDLLFSNDIEDNELVCRK